MGRKKPGRQTRPPAPVRPLWADPGVVLHTSAYRVTLLDTPALAQVTVAAADPNRVAVGFKVPTTLTLPVQFFPDGSADAWGWYVAPDRDPAWFDLFTFGPMVCAAWLCTLPNPAVLAVYEWYTLPGR